MLEAMNVEELNAIGFPTSTHALIYPELKRMSSEDVSPKKMSETLKRIADHPHNFLSDPNFGTLAKAILTRKNSEFVERDKLAPWKQWGEGLEPEAVKQMSQACRLPVSFAGALMPDAHLGYGLPIGGVLATKGAVIPYAVGVDIACRMKLTVLDLPVGYLRNKEDDLITALEEETRFGMGASFSKPRKHAVLDDDWGVVDITKKNFEKARTQLGTSGSGNHFVEFGELQVDEPQLGLEPGRYLALLSHSGSRGAGSAVAERYSALAMELHPELPKELQHLAWLDLDSAEGQEYWAAMQLMGRFAAANHDVIHREIARHLGAEVLADVENHHNFAWKETHFGEDVVVHRKGRDTRRSRGAGNHSRVHGQPRLRGSWQGPAGFSVLSLSWRGASDVALEGAEDLFLGDEVNRQLKKAGVKLISSGLDEVPGVYKDIHEVMAAQSDLVETLATFHPRLVKMSPPGRPKGKGKRE
jgi:tRNA-splicing ligase RtcB